MRSSLRTAVSLGASVVVYLAISTLGSTSSHAACSPCGEFQQDTTLPGIAHAGCATQIAVGPNNVPWVLGCSGPGDGNAWLYKLSCSGTCKWQQQFTPNGTSVAGVSITIDSSNIPWMTSADGHIWAPLAFNGTEVVEDSTTIPGIPSSFSSGRASQIVENGISGALFALGDDLPNHPNVTVFEAQGFSNWNQIGASQGAAGLKLAMFTGNVFGQSYQTLTLTNTQGSFWMYDPSSDSFSQQNGGGIVDLTDHFCVAPSAGAYNLYSWSTLGGVWQNQGVTVTPRGTYVDKIAFANAFQNVGPSQLWGIDTSGNIFYSTWFGAQ